MARIARKDLEPIEATRTRLVFGEVFDELRRAL
jgi:hypothetical protein